MKCKEENREQSGVNMKLQPALGSAQRKERKFFPPVVEREYDDEEKKRPTVDINHRGKMGA